MWFMICRWLEIGRRETFSWSSTSVWTQSARGGTGRNPQPVSTASCSPFSTFYNESIDILQLCFRQSFLYQNIVKQIVFSVTTPLTDLCFLLTRENVNELQQNNMKEMERALALLQEELRKKEADYEEKLLLIRQQQTSKVRCQICFFYFGWSPTKALMLILLYSPTTLCQMANGKSCWTLLSFIRFPSSIFLRRGLLWGCRNGFLWPFWWSFGNQR